MWERGPVAQYPEAAHQIVVRVQRRRFLMALFSCPCWSPTLPSPACRGR